MSTPLDPTVLEDWQIAEAAGQNPRRITYRSGILFCPDIDQPALDAAIAAYNDGAAQAQAKSDQLTVALEQAVDAMWNETAFDQENRIRALEGLGALTRRQFFDLLLSRYRP